jgi:hypothetical protein
MASYAEALRNKSSSLDPTLMSKKCEIFFRDESLPTNMNLHIRSASEQTLVYLLPPRDLSPYDLLTIFAERYNCIEGATVTYTTTGTKLEVFLSVRALYQPITFQDLTLQAIVPTPAALNAFKFNFGSVPLHFSPHSIFTRFLDPMATFSRSTDTIE